MREVKKILLDMYPDRSLTGKRIVKKYFTEIKDLVFNAIPNPGNPDEHPERWCTQCGWDEYDYAIKKLTRDLEKVFEW